MVNFAEYVYNDYLLLPLSRIKADLIGFYSFLNLLTPNREEINQQSFRLLNEYVQIIIFDEHGGYITTTFQNFFEYLETGNLEDVLTFGSGTSFFHQDPDTIAQVLDNSSKNIQIKITLNGNPNIFNKETQRR